MCFEVKEAFRVDKLTEEACLEVQVGACGASGIATESDDVAGFYNLIGLAEMAAHVTVDGLQSVVMADYDVVAVAFRLVFHDAHLAGESRTNSVPHEDLDVCSIMLATESGTVAIVAGDQSAVARHVELSQVNLIFCGECCSIRACVFVIPCGLE